MPVFGRLYYGQVEFSRVGVGVRLRLANFADRPSIIRTLIIKLPEGTGAGTCFVQQGKVGEIRSGRTNETILVDAVVPPKGELTLRWKETSLSNKEQTP
jgi:hypothetical protein